MRYLCAVFIFLSSVAAVGNAPLFREAPSERLLVASFATLTSGVWLASLESDQNGTFATAARGLLERPWSLDESSAPFWLEAHVQAEKGWQNGGALVALGAAYYELANDDHMKGANIEKLSLMIRYEAQDILQTFSHHVPFLENEAWKANLDFVFRLLELSVTKGCENLPTGSAPDVLACKILNNDDELLASIQEQVPDEVIAHISLWDFDEVLQSKQYDLEEMEALDDKTELLKTGLVVGADVGQSFVNKNVLSVAARRMIRTYLFPSSSFLWQEIREHLMVSVFLDVTQLGVQTVLLQPFSRNRLDVPLAKTFHGQTVYLVYAKAKPAAWTRYGRKLGHYLLEKSYKVSLTTVTFPVAILFCRRVLGWHDPEAARLTLAKAILLEVIEDAFFRIADGTIRAASAGLKQLWSEKEGTEQAEPTYLKPTYLEKTESTR